MLISSPSKIENNLLYLKKEILSSLFVKPLQEVYLYPDKAFSYLVISTICLSKNLYYFRIPFPNEPERLFKTAAQFKKHGLNILKSDDVSFGRYAVWHVWATFFEKFAKTEAFSDNYNSLITHLKNLMPEAYRDAELLHVAFEERKFMFFSQPDESLRKETLALVNDDKTINLKKNLLEFGLETDEKRLVILTSYDEFPIILCQIIPSETSLFEITLKIKDKPSTLSETAKFLSLYVDLKASNKTVIKPDDYSFCRFFCTTKDKNSFERLREESYEQQFILAIKSIKRLGETNE